MPPNREDAIKVAIFKKRDSHCSKGENNPFCFFLSLIGATLFIILIVLLPILHFQPFMELKERVSTNGGTETIGMKFYIDEYETIIGDQAEDTQYPGTNGLPWLLLGLFPIVFIGFFLIAALNVANYSPLIKGSFGKDDWPIRHRKGLNLGVIIVWLGHWFLYWILRDGEDWKSYYPVIFPSMGEMDLAPEINVFFFAIQTVGVLFLLLSWNPELFCRLLMKVSENKRIIRSKNDL